MLNSFEILFNRLIFIHPKLIENKKAIQLVQMAFQNVKINIFSMGLARLFQLWQCEHLRCHVLRLLQFHRQLYH